jgi:hypothetical protein
MTIMKRSSQLIAIILTIFFFLNNSCKKEAPYMSDAIITGPDARTCICCGGLMITFNGETRPYTGDFKLIDNGADIGITENDKFPIYVKVDWRANTRNVCNHIIITRIARR